MRNLLWIPTFLLDYPKQKCQNSKHYIFSDNRPRLRSVELPHMHKSKVQTLCTISLSLSLYFKHTHKPVNIEVFNITHTIFFLCVYVFWSVACSRGKLWTPTSFSLLRRRRRCHHPYVRFLATTKQHYRSHIMYPQSSTTKASLLFISELSFLKGG